LNISYEKPSLAAKRNRNIEDILFSKNVPGHASTVRNRWI